MLWAYPTILNTDIIYRNTRIDNDISSFTGEKYHDKIKLYKNQ